MIPDCMSRTQHSSSSNTHQICSMTTFQQRRQHIHNSVRITSAYEQVGVFP